MDALVDHSSRKKLLIDSKNYYQKLIQTLNQLDFNAVDYGIRLIQETWENKKQIICFGNGGSALTAQHFITDWNKSISRKDKPFRGRCLTENMGLVTAYSNDISFQDIFLEQLKHIIEPGDLVIGISGSGNSENVLRALDYAQQLRNKTIGLCGFDGGKLKLLVDHFIWVPINDMQVSEDVHFTFGHIVMQVLCLDKESALKT